MAPCIPARVQLVQRSEASGYACSPSTVRGPFPLARIRYRVLCLRHGGAIPQRGAGIRTRSDPMAGPVLPLHAHHRHFPDRSVVPLGGPGPASRTPSRSCHPVRRVNMRTREPSPGLHGNTRGARPTSCTPAGSRTPSTVAPLSGRALRCSPQSFGHAPRARHAPRGSLCGGPDWLPAPSLPIPGCESGESGGVLATPSTWASPRASRARTFRLAAPRGSEPLRHPRAEGEEPVHYRQGAV
jgi:hypothetical protein